MHLIQDRGIEPPLPEMTGGSSTTVDILGIPHVKQIESAEPFEMLQVISICPKYHLAVVATLGDVVRKSFGYCSCDLGHGRKLLFEVPFVIKTGAVPGINSFDRQGKEMSQLKSTPTFTQRLL
jgi:hypothetical protein